MAQINLLGTQAPKTHVSTLVGSYISKGLALVLVLVLLYYGYLIIAAKSKASSITKLETEIAEVEAKLDNSQQKNQLFTRQAQLKDLQQLLKHHVYWSGLVGEMARVTLKNASYSTYAVTDTGAVQVTVDVPNYQELDKFLQVFDLPQFNKQISNVRIRSITKVQRDNSLIISAKIEFTYNTDSLRK
jgi:cell division protein FtsB